MEYHALIQAFSRTNRILDTDKYYGHIVTFQEPNIFKKNINNALTLFAAGGLGEGAFENFDSVKEDLFVVYNLTETTQKNTNLKVKS